MWKLRCRHRYSGKFGDKWFLQHVTALRGKLLWHLNPMSHPISRFQTCQFPVTEDVISGSEIHPILLVSEEDWTQLHCRRRPCLLRIQMKFMCRLRYRTVFGTHVYKNKKYIISGIGGPEGRGDPDRLPSGIGNPEMGIVISPIFDSNFLIFNFLCFWNLSNTVF